MRPSHSVKSSLMRKAGAVAVATSALLVAGAGSASAAGTVTGSVTCYWPNSDGSVTFAAGYVNTATTTVTIPVGTNNYITPSPQDRGQPTVFLAGSHPSTFVATLTATDMANNPNWYINGVATSYSGTLPQCASKPVSVDGSTTGYLGGTAAIVVIGAYILASPRRRRALTQFVHPTDATASAS